MWFEIMNILEKTFVVLWARIKKKAQTQSFVLWKSKCSCNTIRYLQKLFHLSYLYEHKWA